MAEETQLRPGMNVIGSDGGSLGEIAELVNDPASGNVRAIVIKSGRWLFTNRKEISADIVSRINANTGSVDVGISKAEFRGLPKRE